MRGGPARQTAHRGECVCSCGVYYINGRRTPRVAEGAEGCTQSRTHTPKRKSAGSDEKYRAGSALESPSFGWHLLRGVGPRRFKTWRCLVLRPLWLHRLPTLSLPSSRPSREGGCCDAFQPTPRFGRFSADLVDRASKKLGILGDMADYGNMELPPEVARHRAWQNLDDLARGTRDLWMMDAVDRAADRVHDDAGGRELR